MTHLLQAAVRGMLRAAHVDRVLGGQRVVMVLRWTSWCMAHLLAHDGVLGVALHGCVLPLAMIHQPLGRGALHGDPLSDLHSMMLERSTIELKPSLGCGAQAIFRVIPQYMAWRPAGTEVSRG